MDRLRACLFLLLLLPSVAVAAAPAPVDSAAIDRLLSAEWRRHDLAPARPADDATFLRRVYLDITGTIPPPDMVQSFLQDRARDKRRKMVDALLASPRYAQHFTDYWEAVLLGRAARRQEIDRDAFRGWLSDRLADNLGWDRLVYDLVTATGTNSEGKPDQPPLQEAGPVNGAVNFMILYERNPQDLGGAVSREFLGVQIQCAQCHHHPTEKWSQDDFRRFVASFARVRPKNLDTGPVKGVRRVEVGDAKKPIGGGPMNPDLEAVAKAVPTALDGTDLSAEPDPRRALASWMISPKNPWFARELVNRYWAYFIGRGFSMPVDDLRPSNPVTMPRLLDLLAADFSAHGYDVKRLIRTLCAIQVYQLSSGPARGKDPEGRLWARYPLRPMAPMELLDSVFAATGLQDALAVAAPAGDRRQQVRAKLEKTVSFIFDIDEEIAPLEFEGTVQQVLLLMNGSLINSGAGANPYAALAQVLKEPGGDREKIESLYLRTLSRRPTPVEMDHFASFVLQKRELTKGPPPGKGPQQGGGGGLTPDPLRGLAARLKPMDQTPRQQAFEDLFWALLNSSEFVFRH